MGLVAAKKMIVALDAGKLNSKSILSMFLLTNSLGFISKKRVIGGWKEKQPEKNLACAANQKTICRSASIYLPILPFFAASVLQFRMVKTRKFLA